MGKVLRHYHIIRNQINAMLNPYRRNASPHDFEWIKVREKSLDYYKVPELWEKVDQHLKDTDEFIGEFKDRQRNYMFWILAITFSMTFIFDIIHSLFLPLDSVENQVIFGVSLGMLGLILGVWWLYRRMGNSTHL